MNVKENHITVHDYVTKSNLPASDYVINPYVGCPHACQYCYACFMKRFTGHKEPWGTFVDIKHCERPLSVKRLTGKSVFLSSVTDCYNSLEKKYQITRSILEQLVNIPCELAISTKSHLILRDLNLLTQCKNLKVSMSVNTLDEGFRGDMDHASSIAQRLETLQTLHENGIHTVLFLSPMFPGITDYQAIITRTKDYIDEYWFENLNLRGEYKQRILGYIQDHYPALSLLYHDIYVNKKMDYWADLAMEIDQFCQTQNVHYTNYFYHDKLVAKKLAKSTS